MQTSERSNLRGDLGESEYPVPQQTFTQWCGPPLVILTWISDYRSGSKFQIIF